MFNLPIIVYSKKASDTAYLETVTLDANSTFESEVGVEVTNEIIKAKNYFLIEDFTTTTNFDSGSAEIQTGSGYQEGTWSNGRLECYSSTQAVPLKQTSNPTNPALQSDINTAASNTYALKYTQDLTTKTKNVVVLEGSTNTITLGSNLEDLIETNDGNSFTGNASFNNNPIFYPFVNKPSGQNSRPYGSSNNLVPSGSSVTNIRFHSSSAGTYNCVTCTGDLYIGFDLYNGNNAISSNVSLKLLDKCVGDCSNYSDIDTSYAIAPTLISDNINLRNVRLKIVETGQSFADATYAAALFNTLVLQVEASYTNSLNPLVTTQPEITSKPFKLQTSAEPPVAFTGVGSLSFYGVSSDDGIEVRARFSESVTGLQSANYVYLGTISGQTAGEKILYLNVENRNPAYEAAKNANYIQVNLKSVKNVSSGIYKQSTISRLFSVKEIDPRRKSFTANSFPEKLKFSEATTVSVIENPLFGAFTLKTDGKEKLFSSGSKATYGKLGYKYGAIFEEHLKHNKLTYYAKSLLNNDIETKPLYTSTAVATSVYNAYTPGVGNSKHLILMYDVIVTQGENKYPDINSYGPSTNSNSVKAYLDSFFDSKTNNTSFPHEAKTVYVKSTTSNNLPTELLNKNFAEFAINKSKTYYDSCALQKCADVCTEFKKDENDNCYTWYSYYDGVEQENTTCYSNNVCAKTEEKCTCIGKAIPVNNTYFTFGFKNFREVIIEYVPPTPGTKTKQGRVIEAWSQPYDLNNNPNTEELVGSWIGDVASVVNYIEPQFITVETPIKSFIPTKIILPPINFDTIPANSNTENKSFQAKLLMEFYNGSNVKVGDAISKTFTMTSSTELNIDVPTNVSGAKKIVTYLGIEPIGLTVYEVGLTSTASSKLNITPNRYIVKNKNELNDVGIELLSKPRLEYLDVEIAGQRKVYTKSQVVSKAYNLYNIALTTEGDNISGVNYNHPTIKSGVLFDETTSLPDGTNIKVEWQGSTNGLTWTSWTEDTFSSDLNKQYLRFRVTMTPDSTLLKSPIVDELKLKYWGCSEPYVIKSATLTDDGTTVIFTDLKTKTPVNINNVKVQVSTNDGANYYPASGSAVQYEKLTISNADVDAKVKISILDENVEIEKAVVEILGTV